MAAAHRSAGAGATVPPPPHWTRPVSTTARAADDAEKSIADTYTHTQAYTHIHRHIHIHIHTNTHIHRHTGTQIHTKTHRHTHSTPRSLYTHVLCTFRESRSHPVADTSIHTTDPSCVYAAAASTLPCIPYICMYRGRQEFMKFFVFLFLSIPVVLTPCPVVVYDSRTNKIYVRKTIYYYITYRCVYILYRPVSARRFLFFVCFFWKWLIARILILFYRTHALLLYI